MKTKIFALFLAILSIALFSSCSTEEGTSHPIVGTWDVVSIYFNDQWFVDGDEGVDYSISLSLSENNTYCSNIYLDITYQEYLPDGTLGGACQVQTQGGATGTYEINGEEVVLYYEGQEADRIDISGLNDDTIETNVPLLDEDVTIRAKKR